MATSTSHNKKSSAVKRILSEARELKEPSSEFTAYPLDDNIFEWHFTMRGPSLTEFEEGIYHGRILLPVEYPFRPPDVMILTPNGRWELNKKICLTFTGFHEEMWQPAWGVRTALIGVQAFMSARAEAAVGIGSLDYPTEERERLAKLSGDWRCPVCDKTNAEMLPAMAVEQGERVPEQLPDGLTIDPTGGAAPQAAGESGSHAAEPSTAINGATISEVSGSSNCVNPPSLDLPHVHSEQYATSDHNVTDSSTFGGATGPTNAMLGQMLHSRLEAAARQESISSSQVSTPRPLTPAQQGDVEDSSLHDDKGKRRQMDTIHADEGVASSSSASSSAPRGNNGIPLSRSDHGAFASIPPPPPPQRDPTDRAPATRHRASSAEASAQRLAALDRAIGTVIFLLAALVLRRLLNAWYA